VGKVRGRRNANHYAAVAKWEREGVEQSESVQFTREILPVLQDIPLGKMARATGLTEGYCSFVRRGLKVPHCRHWNTPARLGETDVL
jgi:hypothetical protein